MAHTREDLEALTAKALRPIAADLGVTGSSRMKKDEIITAIITAQTADAAKDVLDVADFDEEAVYAQSPALDDSEEPVRDLRMKYTDEQLIALDKAAEAPKFKAGDQFEIVPCEGVRSVVELIERDPNGGPGFAWKAKAADAVGTPLTLTEDFLSQAYVTKIPEAEYVTRTMRTGVETAVVEQERNGRTYFRVIDPKTGRRSAPYNMRTIAFRAQYSKVPS